MKKSVKILLLVTALAVAMCVSVLAANGVYDVAPETDFATTVTVVPKTADGTAIESVEATADDQTVTFYEGAEKFDVTYSATTEGNYYLVLILSADGAPTEETIVYIDQVTAGGTSATFATYPSALAAGDYFVYISGNDGMGYKKVATFTQGEASTTPPYILGDISLDGEILINDATLALNAIAGNIELTAQQILAAEVSGDGELLINDATLILNYIAGNVTVFPAANS